MFSTPFPAMSFARDRQIAQWEKWRIYLACSWSELCEEEESCFPSDVVLSHSGIMAVFVLIAFQGWLLRLGLKNKMVTQWRLDVVDWMGQGGVWSREHGEVKTLDAGGCRAPQARQKCGTLFLVGKEPWRLFFLKWPERKPVFSFQTHTRS